MTEQPDIEIRGFEQFVAERGKVLWRAAWLLTGDSQHAEDLVQTALSKCFTRYDDMDGDEAPAPARHILTAVARHCVTPSTSRIKERHHERRVLGRLQIDHP